MARDLEAPLLQNVSFENLKHCQSSGASIHTDVKELHNAVVDTIKQIKEELDEQILGLGTPRGEWDASTGSYPTTGTLNDFWKVSVAGSVGDVDFKDGDYISCKELDADGNPIYTKVGGTVNMAGYTRNVFVGSGADYVFDANEKNGAVICVRNIQATSLVCKNGSSSVKELLPYSHCEFVRVNGAFIVA